MSVKNIMGLKKLGKIPYYSNKNAENVKAMIEYGHAHEDDGWAKRSYKPRPWKEVLLERQKDRET